MRKILLAAGLLAVLGGGWWFAGMPGHSLLPGGAGASAAQPRLRTAPADRGTITAVVAATGTVNPVTLVQVGSQLSGQIRELFADFNTRVAEGMPIARLDTATIEARRAAAEADMLAAAAQVAVARAQAERSGADVAQARAQIEAARAAVLAVEASARDADAEAARSAELRARGVGAERDALRARFAAERSAAAVTQAQADLLRAEAAAMSAVAAARTAAAQIEAAEAARAQREALLRQVEVDLNNATIRSPIAGVVVSRNIDIGQTVAASFQAPVLFQIAASLDEMEVHATVDEADIGRVRPGQEVTFTVAAFPAETLRGRVKDIRLAATTVQNVVTYTVVVTTPNASGRLLPGMTATLRIVIEERAQALRVPNAALRWRPPGAAGSQAAEAAPGQAQLEQALAALTDLTEAQRAEIDAARAEMRARLQSLPSDSEARRQQTQAARQRLIARLNAVLTPDQRARLAAMRGGGPRQGGQPGTVWVTEAGGAPRAVPVRIGITDGSVTEILSGELEHGMAVVLGQERAGFAAAPAAQRRLF